MNDDEPQDIIAGLRNALIFTLAFMGLVAGASLILRDGEDAEVIAKIESEARERKSVRPELCIVQFEAGAKWLTQRPVYTCAPSATVLSGDVLTMPVSK